MALKLAGVYYVTCEECGIEASDSIEDMGQPERSAIDALEDAGWLVQEHGGKREYTCPKCKPIEAPDGEPENWRERLAEMR